MFCQKCGNEINNSMKFCPNCGHKTIEENKNMNLSKQSSRKTKRVTLLVALTLVAIGVCVAGLTVVDNASRGTKTIYVLTKAVYFDAHDPEGVPQDSEEYEYDELGNLKRSTFYHTSYSYSSSSGLSDVESNAYLTVYSYDDKGYRDGVKMFLNDEMVSQGTVKCDKQGRVVKEEYLEGASFYTYDKNGNTLEYWCTENDEITYREVYTYNTNGDPLTFEVYMDGNIISTRCEYEYDLKNKLIRITEIGYYSDGTSENYGIAIYNESGSLSEVVYYDDDGYPDRILKFDVAGNLVESSEYYKGEIVRQTTNTYEAMEVPQ